MINLMEFSSKLNISECVRPVNQSVTVITVSFDVEVIYSKTEELGLIRFYRYAVLRDSESYDNRPELMLSEVVDTISVIFNTLKEIVQTKEIPTKKEIYKIDDINYHTDMEIKNKMSVSLDDVGTPAIMI